MKSRPSFSTLTLVHLIAATLLLVHPVAAQTQVTGTYTGAAGAPGMGSPPDGDGESDGNAGGSGYNADGSVSPSFTVHDANLTGGRGGDVTGAGTALEYKAGSGGDGLSSSSNAVVTVNSGTFTGGNGGNTGGAGGTQQSQGGNGGNGAGIESGATVTINAGTFQGGIGGTSSATGAGDDSGGGGGAGLFVQGATVHINGGVFQGAESGLLAGEPASTSTGFHGGGLNANSGSIITIKGGTFQGGNDVPVASGGQSSGADGLTGLGGTVNVFGGTFLAGNDGNGHDEGFGIDAVFGGITVHGQFTLTTGGHSYADYTGSIPSGNGSLTGFFDGSTTQETFTYDVEDGTGATLTVVPEPSTMLGCGFLAAYAAFRIVRRVRVRVG